MAELHWVDCHGVNNAFVFTPRGQVNGLVGGVSEQGLGCLEFALFHEGGLLLEDFAHPVPRQTLSRPFIFLLEGPRQIYQMGFFGGFEGKRTRLGSVVLAK